MPRAPTAAVTAAHRATVVVVVVAVTVVVRSRGAEARRSPVAERISAVAAYGPSSVTVLTGVPCLRLRLCLHWQRWWLLLHGSLVVMLAVASVPKRRRRVAVAREPATARVRCLGSNVQSGRPLLLLLMMMCWLGGLLC